MGAAKARCYRTGRVESDFGPLRCHGSAWDLLVGDELYHPDGTVFVVEKIHRALEPDGLGDIYFNIDVVIK